MTAARWLLEAVPWMEHANCLGMNPDVFFPERGEDNTGAITICHGCQVRVECLDYATANHIVHGIWGGQSERQRRRHRAGKPADVLQLCHHCNQPITLPSHIGPARKYCSALCADAANRKRQWKQRREAAS